MTPKTLPVVFTDLDGTLLDHYTYSFAAAREALDLLRRRHIPLILCSSKTRAELELLQLDLRVGQHPLISENGGGIFVPRGYFPFAMNEARPALGYEVIEFGLPYFRLVESLHRAAQAQRVRVVGFSDLSVEEIAAECGLSLLEARLVKLRDYDEPFRVLDADPSARSHLMTAFHRAGLRCTRGGRYHHLTGRNDKGRAVRALKALYQKAGYRVLAIGLGDGLNDLPMLREMDVPIVVPNPAAGATARLLKKVPTARLAPHPGAAGWNLALLAVLGARAKGADQPGPVEPSRESHVA
jgi:mannosyl-3-phosphoglycerate phosphatase